MLKKEQDKEKKEKNPLQGFKVKTAIKSGAMGVLGEESPSCQALGDDCFATGNQESCRLLNTLCWKV